MKNQMLCIFALVFFFAGVALAQPTIEWQKSLGGSANEKAHSIQQTFDGGFIITGWTRSNNGDVSGYHGGGSCDAGDYWVVKLDAESPSSIVWQKCLGGSLGDAANSIQQTTDGGYVVVGFTNSNDGDVSGNHGLSDYWVVKLDALGDIVWQKCLGGHSSDGASSIQQTTDGGYIVAGFTNSNDGDVSGNHGLSDYWVVKLNSSGSIEWQRCLGGSDYDGAYFIQQTTDSGYVIAGLSYSNDGDVSGNHGGEDYWVVKLNAGGGSSGRNVSAEVRLRRRIPFSKQSMVGSSSREELLPMMAMSAETMVVMIIGW